MGSHSLECLSFLTVMYIMLVTNVNGVAPLEKYSNQFLNDFNVSSSDLIHGSDNLEMERYKIRVKIVHQMLRDECPKDLLRHKRNILSSQIGSARGEIERVLFDRMVRMLAQCRQIKEATSDCITATNLTEYWRKDHTGQSVGGESNCDTRDMKSSGRPWFRFSGAAGTQLLNTCPPPNSCGTHAGIWSNETMPSWVGQSLDITAYGSYTSGCTEFPEPVTVLKCSNKPGDYIYKYNGDSSCHLGFCGMDR